MSDPVNHPKHYNHGKFEVIDVIEDWGLGFNDGNVVKYVARHRHKNGLEDLKKARWYLDREITRLELQAQGRAVHPMGQQISDDPVSVHETEPGANGVIAALASLTPAQEDEVTNYLLGCGGAWGSTGTSFRGNWRRPRHPTDIVAALVNLAPEQRDELVEGVLAAKLPWLLRFGDRSCRCNGNAVKSKTPDGRLCEHSDDCPKAMPWQKNRRGAPQFRVRFELGDSFTNIDVDLSRPLITAVGHALRRFGRFVGVQASDWEVRNSQGDRLPLDAPLDPRLVPDGKVRLAPATGHGG